LGFSSSGIPSFCERFGWSWPRRQSIPCDRGHPWLDAVDLFRLSGQRHVPVLRDGSGRCRRFNRHCRLSGSRKARVCALLPSDPRRTCPRPPARKTGRVRPGRRCSPGPAQAAHDGCCASALLARATPGPLRSLVGRLARGTAHWPSEADRALTAVSQLQASLEQLACWRWSPSFWSAISCPWLIWLVGASSPAHSSPPAPVRPWRPGRSWLCHQPCCFLFGLAGTGSTRALAQR